MLPDFDIICFATVGEATGSTSSRKWTFRPVTYGVFLNPSNLEA